MSARTRPDLETVPGYVPGKTVPGAIKLSSNETTHGPLPGVVTAITEAAANVNRYPDNRSSELVEAIAAFLRVPADNVTAGCGSVALCQELVQITCNAGDEVIYAWRSFETYPIITKIAGATPVEVPLTETHTHDLDAMLGAVTERTRLIFVCNPNNPTGTVVLRAKLEAFLDAVPSNILVVLDEAYFEYERGDLRTDGVEVGRERPNVIVLRTFSKAYGLAGMRVGYAVGDPKVISAMSKVHVAFSVSTVAQSAALASLASSAELLARTDAIVSERVRVADQLRERGYDVPVAEANFVWLALGDQSTAFAAAATEAGVLLRAFAGDGVRITIGDPHENDAFLEFVRTYSAVAV